MEAMARGGADFTELLESDHNQNRPVKEAKRGRPRRDNTDHTKAQRPTGDEDMSEAPTQDKRELVLTPDSYAYMQDQNGGSIKTFVGPTTINQTQQEKPVYYDNGHFSVCHSIKEAVRKCAIAVEGYYLVLRNPVGPDSDDEHPPTAAAGKLSPELNVGRKINIPGPCMFALWPGQHAEIIKGHHLRSNQYLLMRVYNEEEARRNWTTAIVKAATAADGEETTEVMSDAPDDLTVGKQFVIKGNEVSFYMPPTGMSVVPDENGDYVRDALTLERLEYAVLVDEDGNKEIPQGPDVVFPRPTQQFIVKRGDRKFRALELNPIQGIHIKVIAPYTDEKTGEEYKAGDELFITGKDTPIYFPREEHSIVTYDGKSKHFATAIPAGEARYVLDRMAGTIEKITGPAMLLPDPRTHVIIRRVLTDAQCGLWYPGNQEALEYNQHLRNLLANVPTTRAGAISEGDYERGTKKGGRGRQSKMYSSATSNDASLMEKSQVSYDADVVGEEFSRGSTYTEPRTVTLDTKYHGVPTIDVWTGYAVQIVSRSGERKVEIGPKSILLNYDEVLEAQYLSTDKPKTTDHLIHTVYLRIKNNKVTDIVIGAETSDHVMLDLKLSYNVDFVGDKNKWFDVENYVKFLCDHIRSVLKGVIKKIPVDEFYANSTDIIRDVLLGEKDVETGERTGMAFDQNNMVVRDVEVLKVTITDERIRGLLDETQHRVVEGNIEAATAKRNLSLQRERSSVDRELKELSTATELHGQALDAKRIDGALTVRMADMQAALLQTEKQSEVSEAKQSLTDMEHERNLAREKAAHDQRDAFASLEQARQLALLEGETTATVTRFNAAQGGFSESLLALSNNETLGKVAQAMGIQEIIGGRNISEAVSHMFAGTPIAGLVERVMPGDGNGKKQRQQRPNA
jgi:major vault protein